jgi:putative tryptophan/tyrosine transport system substrate-binding protein
MLRLNTVGLRANTIDYRVWRPS